MTEEKYQQMIRLLAIVTAVALWIISAIFSVDGFAFVVPKYAWMGYVLALVITSMELIFAEKGGAHTLTIVLASLGSYLYDIGTNVIGIYAAQGAGDLRQNPLLILFPLLLGIFLAIVPEPLLLYGLLGKSTRDVLLHLLGKEND